MYVDFLKRYINLYLHVDACEQRLIVGIENLKINESLLDYNFGKSVYKWYGFEQELQLYKVFLAGKTKAFFRAFNRIFLRKCVLRHILGVFILCIFNKIRAGILYFFPWSLKKTWYLCLDIFRFKFFLFCLNLLYNVM